MRLLKIVNISEKQRVNNKTCRCVEPRNVRVVAARNLPAELYSLCFDGVFIYRFLLINVQTAIAVSERKLVDVAIHL